MNPAHLRLPLKAILPLVSGFALLTLAVPLAGSESARHLRLIKSEPADSAVVATAPDSIRLWYSEDPPLSVTRVALTRGRDTVALGRPIRARPAGSPIVFPVTGSMLPGTHTVSWRTMGSDGHVITGSFTIRFAPASAGDEEVSAAQRLRE